MNGKTLGKWNWEDSASGSFTRNLDLNQATENRAVFVLVSGPNLYAIQGLFTGSQDNSVNLAAGEATQPYSASQKAPMALDKKSPYDP